MLRRGGSKGSLIYVNKRDTSKQFLQPRMMRCSITFIFWTSLMVVINYTTGFVVPVYEVEPNVTGISAAYFGEHEVVTYETTAKVVFRVKIPFLQHIRIPLAGTKMEMNQTINLIQDTTTRLVDDFWSFIKGLEQSKRSKRQVILGAAAIGAFAGYEIHSIFTKLSRELTGTEEDAEQKLNMLKEAMAESQTEHLLFVHTLTEFSKNLTSTVNKLVKTTSESDRSGLWLLHLIQLLIAITRTENGISRCEDRLIPIQLLGSDNLFHKLHQMREVVSRQGYELSVPLDDFARYESLAIASCYVTGTNIYSILNIPLRKSVWKIQEMIPVPFANFNSTCSLTDPQSVIMAISPNKIVSVDTFMKRSCDLSPHGLCLIPPYSHYSKQTIACAASLYHRASINDVVNVCEFKCSNSTEMQIFEVERHSIVVTFAKKIAVRCPEKSTKYKVRDFGAVQMKIKCNCTYVIDDLVFNGQGVCINEIFQNDDIVSVLPYFVIDPEGESKKHQRASVSLVPDIQNMTYKSHQTELQSVKVMGMHYRDFWLAVVSCLIFLLIVAAAVISYVVRKLQ